MDARRLARVTKQADQSLSFILRILKDQQADGFLLRGHGCSFRTRRRGA